VETKTAVLEARLVALETKLDALVKQQVITEQNNDLVRRRAIEEVLSTSLPCKRMLRCIE